MVFNNTKLRAFDFSQKAIKYLNEELGNHRFHDQSAINVISYEKIKPLKREFNQFDHLTKTAKDELELLETKAHLYHFIKKPKPWINYNYSIHSQILYKIAKIISLDIYALKCNTNLWRRLRRHIPLLFKFYYNCKKYGPNKNFYRDAVEHVNQILLNKKYLINNKNRLLKVLENVEHNYRDKLKADA